MFVGFFGCFCRVVCLFLLYCLTFVCFCWFSVEFLLLLGCSLVFVGFFVCLFRQQPLLQVQLRVLQPWEAQRQEQGRQQGQELAWVALPILKVPGQKWPHHT